MYDTICKQLQNYNHNIIIGTDQNFYYITIDQHKSGQWISTNYNQTRITHSTATLIDNIYISVKTKTNIKSGILCTDISDHLHIIVCTGNTKKDSKKTPLIIQKRYMTDVAIQHINSTIQNQDWNYLNNMTMDDAYTEFNNKLGDIIEYAAPQKTITIPSSLIIRDPWMTRGLIKSSKTLNKLHKRRLGNQKLMPFMTNS